VSQAFEAAAEQVRAVLEPAIAQKNPLFFESGEQQTLRETGRKVSDFLDSVCQRYLAVVRGLDDGTGVGVPGIEVNFPARLWKGKGRSALDANQAAVFDDLVTETFFLGLATHFVLQIADTRPETHRVDPETLLGQFLMPSLAAHTVEGTYDRMNGGIPSAILGHHVASTIRPHLKKVLRLGFWAGGKALSNFKNLFWAGVLLGMLWDTATKVRPEPGPRPKWTGS
jgi:hypothetical protein